MKLPTALVVIFALEIFGANACQAMPDMSGLGPFQATIKLLKDRDAAIMPRAQTRIQRSIRIAQNASNMNSEATSQQTTQPPLTIDDNPPPSNSIRNSRRTIPSAVRRIRPIGPAGPIPIPYPNDPFPPEPPAPCVPFTICGPETLPLPSSN